MGAAHEGCAAADIGVAGGECAVAMGAARVDDLIIAKKQRKIMVRRDAKSGVRNALAGSGAEIQGKFEFSSKKSEKKKNMKFVAFTLRFLAARATARFCWCTWCCRLPGSVGWRGGRGSTVLFWPAKPELPPLPRP